MENWGLLTYKEQALYVSPEKASFSQKQRAVLPLKPLIPNSRCAPYRLVSVIHKKMLSGQ